jgi:YVTN family beta-propeller protein
LITRRSLLLAPLAALAGCGHRKGAGFDGYAFVANEEGKAIAAVDLTAFAVARHIHLDASPTALIADPVRPAVYALTPATGSVHEIGSGTLAFRRKVQIAHAAVAMRLSPDGRAIWVLARQPRRLIRLPLDTFQPDAHITLPGEPVDFDISESGEWAGISFGESGVVGLVDLQRGTCSSIVLGKRLSLARFRKDGRQLLVGNAEDRMLSILEVPGGRVVVHLPLAVRPDYFCFSADQGQLFVTGAGMDAVVVVFPYWTEVAGALLAGRAPGAMADALGTDAEFLLVANSQSGQVTIVDVETRRAIAGVAVGQGPVYITVTPDQQYALVLNCLSGDMAVIRIAAISATRAKSAPLFTMIPVGSKPVCAVVRGV